MIEDAEDRLSDDNQDDDELEEVSKQLAAKKELSQQGERAQEARAHHDGQGQGILDLR
jgi:hypothetical protein